MVDRGYGKSGVDFLTAILPTDDFCIITNPPYNLAKEFILRGVEICDSDVVFILPIRYLEGKARYNEIFKNRYLKEVYIPTWRVKMYRNNADTHCGNAMCHSWFVFNRNGTGDPVIKWLNDDLTLRLDL